MLALIFLQESLACIRCRLQWHPHNVPATHTKWCTVLYMYIYTLAFPGQLMTGTTYYQRYIVITVTALFLESLKSQVHQFPTDHHQLCQPISQIYGKRSIRPLYLYASALSHRVRSPINMFCTWVRSPTIMFAYCNHIYSLLYILIISTN